MNESREYDHVMMTLLIMVLLGIQACLKVLPMWKQRRLCYWNQ